MPSGPTTSGATNVDSSDTNSYPTQRHAGKVGYGPNFASGGGLIDKLTGLAYEVKGKVTHDPALVHHGHEVFTGEAKRKKTLGIEEDDPPLSSGQNSGNQHREHETTSHTVPSTGAITSSAEFQDKVPSFGPGTKPNNAHAPETITSQIQGPAVEHLEQS